MRPPIWAWLLRIEIDAKKKLKGVEMDKTQIANLQVVRTNAGKMREILGLSAAPVGVKFISGAATPEGAEQLSHHRYCQALMKARLGWKVFLDAEGIVCPAAAAAFGFRPLPEPLKTGKGLVGFGIVSDPQVGQNMFVSMPKLAAGQIDGLYLFPLEQADVEPDVIVLEDEVEKLMWIALADLHMRNGSRVNSSTAILQATCVDATVIPFLEKRLNLSYGCRDATDIRSSETVLGFPASILQALWPIWNIWAKRRLPIPGRKKLTP